jgi:short-subunit dehydrogenase
MNPKIDEWLGKRVWIIGASTGIGAETARLLLKNGAEVALSARGKEALESIAHGNPKASVYPLDITAHDTVLAARDQIVAKWSRIDLVLVIAGGYNEMRADNFELAIANKLIDLNLRGVMNCLDAVLPTLLKQRSGGIGIVGSVAGYSGLPKALIYGPTKAAIINLCESLYLDLRPQGIAVYMINPGFVDTTLTEQNDFKMPALMTPADAATSLVNGLESGAFHIHFPKRFTNWVRFARLLPYRWYFALIHKVTGL